jgi:hypothetical protein
MVQAPKANFAKLYFGISSELAIAAADYYTTPSIKEYAP